MMTFLEAVAAVEQLAGDKHFSVGVELSRDPNYAKKCAHEPQFKKSLEWTAYVDSKRGQGPTPETMIEALKSEIIGKVAPTHAELQAINPEKEPLSEPATR